MVDDTSPSFESTPSFIYGHTPKAEEVQYSIGHYQIIGSVGKGGMGEVLLAYDTKCGRKTALKKVREDLLEHKKIHQRFLKEARITSQLTHPAIIPIYTIQDKNQVTYYTMPYVQGETLKQVLRTTRNQEKQGKPLHHLGGSIPALVRTFLSICQGVAYAHSKGVLHRDLKPENIILGEYGEVLILDWGLAKLVDVEEQEEDYPEASSHPDHELTRLGKVVGTINFMAPERAMGQPASIQTEVYALGVILFQLLTLQNPFHRGTLEEFRENMDKEKLPSPIEVAPYRDVPKLLSQIVLKCLSKKPTERYQTVDELIHDLESYIEGRSEWFEMAKLNINNKNDWEFQENVLIAEHTAITRATDQTEWVSLMISKASFTGNTKIEATVSVGEKGHGLGFLMSIPEAAEREHLNDGYCLWLGSEINKSTKLLRSTVEVVHAPEIFLKKETSYRIRIEKIDHNIYFYLNDTLQFTYISHLPLAGTHVGLIARDADYSLKDFTIYVGGHSIMVNCLAVPDAFLAHKDYPTALNEYRRIGYSFPGRAEGREAMFRAGITLLEQSRTLTDPQKKQSLLEQALEEFEKLHSTPGAPLEYLGKAHVYQAMHDIDDEMRCYELAFRRYPNHPLLPVLHEHLIYRMHETSRFHRLATYQLMLTAVRHLPEATVSNSTQKLFVSLKRHWEKLDFIQEDPDCKDSNKLDHQHFGIQIAFWLAIPHAYEEFIKQLIQSKKPHPITLANALFCLIELDQWELAKEQFSVLPEALRATPEISLIHSSLICHENAIEAAKCAVLNTPPGFGELRVIFYLIEKTLNQQHLPLAKKLIQTLSSFDLSKEVSLKLNCYDIWASLLEKDWKHAERLLHQYPLIQLTKEDSLLSILYGCWLASSENQEIADIHFSGVLDVTFPRTWTLLAHFLNGKIDKESNWNKMAFPWEKRQLFRQLSLYYHCIGEEELSTKYQRLAEAALD